MVNIAKEGMCGNLLPGLHALRTDRLVNHGGARDVCDDQRLIRSIVYPGQTHGLVHPCQCRGPQT